ncbi:hypothetical protein BBM34_20640 [Vibrio parahaemolyticus]|uniref:hypothetical protein n=1 Tax=Vibrio parahaemolyticus TaxID=670 RepID=UPI00084BAC37|nr:hypothetical protein [Vibrio parahaemolyticus]EGQ9805610.1 hypothetical protein [Vibrio parahaemolyticus]EII3097683.1 hypothetical protein [Vibrio parahaemolyticus]MBE4200903.1 hypothetical protein [Vibrio parahaemolyticus]MBE4200916.1 hypothetical protein [Vibrio parahaemolyticus]ODZ06403.1 hypothetical protein BBM34_20640 [Vibrio parahaemolyticus]
MNKEIELTCYRLDKLGIYSDEHEPYLSPKDLMKELKAWAFDSRKPLVETQTFDANSQTLEAYCLDFYEKDGDYILGLWNKVHASNKGVGTVRKNAIPETAKVNHTRIDEDSIPGFPTYFYISPKHNLIAPIKIDLRQSGILAFRYYMRGYLRNYCSHLVDRMDGDVRIRGLCTTSSIGLDVDLRFPVKSAHPLVSFTLDMESVEKQYFIENAHSITKVVKDLSSEQVIKDDEHTSIERFVRAFKGLPMTKRRSSRVTMPVDLTQDHVKKLFEAYESSGGSDEYNVGFRLRGESKTHWMSGAARVITLEGQIRFHEVDQPDLESLMQLIKNSGVFSNVQGGEQQNVA